MNKLIIFAMCIALTNCFFGAEKISKEEFLDSLYPKMTFGEETFASEDAKPTDFKANVGDFCDGAM